MKDSLVGEGKDGSQRKGGEHDGVQTKHRGLALIYHRQGHHQCKGMVQSGGSAGRLCGI